MIDCTRLFLGTALVFCLLSLGGNAWGQLAFAPDEYVGGTYPASTAAAYWSFGGQPGSYPRAASGASYPTTTTMYVPYFAVPSGSEGSVPPRGANVIPASHLRGGNPEQKPLGALAPEGSLAEEETLGEEGAPIVTAPESEAELPDFDFDFQEQSAGFIAEEYAAAPSMIGDFFGGGSSTAMITNVMPFALTAQGSYIAGLPGDTSATIAFDVSVPNGSTDFFSVGPALTPDGRQFAITEPVPPTDAPVPTTPGFTFDGGTATNSAQTIGNLQFWDVVYSFSDSTNIVIPDPGGSVVGRMKIAENASPVPRDRVFINYSLFDNVPLHAGGVTVNRITPGFEKLSPSGDASVEVRFPFASTLSSNIISDGATEMGNTEFGNIFVTYKRVLEKSDNWLVSGGLSLTIPTASDLNVTMSNGEQLVHVDNRSVHLMPFLGGVTSLGDRVFAHGFMQFDFDTSGNPVQLNLTGNGLSTVGTVQATNFVYLDMGMGFWVRRPGDCPNSRITSIVPTVELHINRSLQPTDVIVAGPFRIGQRREAIQLDAFVLGCTVGMAGGNSFTTGYAIPYGNGSDQAFDGELRAFWNRAF